MWYNYNRKRRYVNEGGNGSVRNKLVFWLVPSACALLAALLIGFFLGRNTVSDTLRVQTERPAVQPVFEEVMQEEEIQTVDLNTADAQALMAVPGVGEVLAQRILEYRELAGGFALAEQLLEVEGIGEAKFAQIRAYIKVEGSYEDSGR